MAGNRRDRPRQDGRKAPCFAAIDLGTNNCRLLIASPRQGHFRVVDAFSRIVRLGEGVSTTGMLSDGAMDRTLEALAVCASKMKAREVHASRCIATQACRSAENGQAFLERVRAETGLALEIATAEEEASLSVRGCTDLIDPQAKAAMVFDIGGGSTEISWLRVTKGPEGRVSAETVAWTSLPFGVVTMAERHGDVDMSVEAYSEMAASVAATLRSVSVPSDIRAFFDEGAAHLIGTSGTVTSIAGVHLGLTKYSRTAVDGLWLTNDDVIAVSERLRVARFDERAGEVCIGRERADLVVPGCAILAGILDVWPASRVRVGDRGLREGLLIDLISEWRRDRRA